MNGKVLILAVALSCLLVGSTQAAFQWKLAPEVGKIVQLKYSNYEQILDTGGGQLIPDTDPEEYYPDPTGAIIAAPNSPGDTLQGIFKITTIQYQNGTQLWAEDWLNDDTQHLVGYFDELISESPTILGVGNNFTGGILNIFYVDENIAGNVAFDPLHSLDDGGAIGAGVGYDGAVAGRTMPLFISADGVGGIDPSDPGATLSSLVTATNPLTGKGSGYWDVTGGLAEEWFSDDYFDPTHTIPGMQDMLLESDYKQVVNETEWLVTSQDPLSGLYAIPEPMSVLVWGMLGVCAAGFGVIRRKK